MLNNGDNVILISIIVSWGVTIAIMAFRIYGLHKRKKWREGEREKLSNKTEFLIEMFMETPMILDRDGQECTEILRNDKNQCLYMVQFIKIDNAESEKYLPIAKKKAKIGRRSELGVDIVVDDKSVSGIHAVIICENGKIYIEDLESKNGTMINDVLIPSNKKIEVDGDDVISIGRSAFRLCKLWECE